MKKNTFLFVGVLCIFGLAYSLPLKAAPITIDPLLFSSQSSIPSPKSNEPFTIDAKTLETFFVNHPKFKKYKPDTQTLYANRQYKTIWHDEHGLTELSHLLYSKTTTMEEELGIQPKIPYQYEIDQIFNETSSEKPSKKDAELLITCLYIYYTDKVYDGLDEKKVKSLGWYLPKKDISYEKILDSLLLKPSLLDKNTTVLFSQYYKLEKVLKKYIDIQKSNEWQYIEHDTTTYREYKPDDTSKVIRQIRHQLHLFGDLKSDSQKNIYDEEMMAGVLNFKKRHGLKQNYDIAPEHIRLLNKPMESLIHTLMVNMERCRWIPPQLEKQNQYIMVNIPSFRMIYVKNGSYALVSNVFVGSRMNETVIFSGQLNQIVFSPTWTVPASIVQNELEFKLTQDPDYLEKNNIEKLKNGQYRQKPGPNNSLGLVKFLFPNPNDIYMHDTPRKALFNFESRTFSHGCINLEKAKELSYKILEDDPKWTKEKIDQAMSSDVEVPYKLKNPIPIYIGYFTAWVGDTDEVSFFIDIYSRDEHLYHLLYEHTTEL